MNRLTLIIFTFTFILASCGGGGGGGGGSSAPSNPAPVTNLSISASSVVIGTEITLTWSSSNASSCSADGAWSGSKDTSGNESIVATESGTFSFGLTCSSGSSSSSKTVSLDVSPALNAYAYINGPTTFSGFYIFKQKDTAAMIKSIEVDIEINDQDSLYISQFRYSENRYLAAFSNENGSADGLGLRLGQNYNVDDSGEQNTYYIPQVSEVFHSSNQIILNTDNSINPYSYLDNVSSIDDLEIFSADIILDFDPDYIPTYSTDDGEKLYSHDNIRMSLYAVPKGEDTNDATFIGTYRNNDNYAFLYLIDKREVDEYSNNLPNESDIFGKNLLMLEVYNSYQSQPNLELITENGFRTKSAFAQINNLSNNIAEDTLDGSRLADAIDVSTNETLGAGNSYAIKYLQPDDTSSQRFFLKTSLRSDSFFSNDCFDSYSYYRRCDAINWQLYFFTPNKESLAGFKLGGYFDDPHQTNARFLFSNDDD